MSHREQVRDQICSWLKNGIKEPSLSKYYHPLVVVKRKRTDEVRISLDVQELNKYVENLKAERIED